MNRTNPRQIAQCDLYVKPRVKRFDTTTPGSLQSLAEYLQTLDSNSRIRQIEDPSEIQLTNKARTVRDGYQLTSPAFRQAAQIIGPGLSKLLPDIAGVTKQGSDDRSALIDSRCAIRFWNDLVDLRFPLFQRYRVICNVQEHTIEGFVSYKHQYLENVWLYHESVAMLANHDPDVAAYAATVIGRRFAIWFRHRRPAFTITHAGQHWPFYSGYFFTNGEATGTSVRGTVAVFTPWGVCLGAYRKYGRRVTHVGREFVSRLGDMFSSVIHCEIPWDKVEAGARLLLTKPLGFVATWNEEQRKERCKKISHALGSLGVQKNLAVEATDLALAVGRHHGMDATAWSQVQELYASRTVLDLFIPLLSIARRVDLTRRERLEQAAFEVLIGRLSL